MDFTGRHVVITGGSSGIGLATAKIIAGAGGKVSLLARRANVLGAAAAEIGPAAIAMPCDVGIKGELLTALDAAEKRGGPIDGLFLNAAAPGIYALTSDYSDEAFEECLRVNVWSPFWALRHVLPAMVERRNGAILLTGTLGAVRGMAGNMG
jgi:NAD(P)-dependent dehydrogenase (short-subunit alcohol dehydrogenase family)